MGKLGSGIASKVANATGPVIDHMGELFRTRPFSIPNPLAMCPVLAEEAVKGTSVVKDCKILKPIFWTRSISKLWVS
jgi:hypothetical protein